MLRDEIFKKTHDFGVAQDKIDLLFKYEEILIKWQKSINLISNNTVDKIWDRHILDSIQLHKMIPNESKVIVDMGSGGGFPAMVLAILFGQDKEIHMIESDRKKCSFLKEVSRNCGIKPVIHNKRIEDISDLKADVVIARALASLDKLIKYSKIFAKSNTMCLFLKGSNVEKEINAVQNDVELDFEKISSCCGDGTIIKVKIAP